MQTSRITISTPDTDLMIRTAMERIRVLEAEVRRLQARQPGEDKYIRVLQGQRLLKVPVTDILFIRAESNYSRIFLKSGEQYYMSKTLKSWIAEITVKDFLRCHRSFFVNKKEIIEINRYTNHIIMRNGEQIPTSRRHHKDCSEYFFQRQETMHAKTDTKLNCTVHKLRLKPDLPGE